MNRDDPSPAPADPSHQAHDRLQRVEEAMLFTQHGQDQLAQHVLELARMLDRLDERLARMEELSRRLDTASNAHPDSHTDPDPAP